MSYWYLARVELHEYLGQSGQMQRPSEPKYTAVHVAMRTLGFSRMVIFGADDTKFRLPDGTYDKKEVNGDNPELVLVGVEKAVKNVWPVAGIVIARYNLDECKQSGLKEANLALIDFEKNNAP